MPFEGAGKEGADYSRAKHVAGHHAGDRNARGGGGLPLAGRIAAGRLQEAVEQDERIDFSEMFGADDQFVLEVRGDSMIEDQIADGDYVVVRKQDTASAARSWWHSRTRTKPR